MTTSVKEKAQQTNITQYCNNNICTLRRYYEKINNRSKNHNFKNQVQRLTQ